MGIKRKKKLKPGLTMAFWQVLKGGLSEQNLKELFCDREWMKRKIGKTHLLNENIGRIKK